MIIWGWSWDCTVWVRMLWWGWRKIRWIWICLSAEIIWRCVLLLTRIMPFLDRIATPLDWNRNQQGNLSSSTHSGGYCHLEPQQYWKKQFCSPFSWADGPVYTLCYVLRPTYQKLSWNLCIAQIDLIYKWIISPVLCAVFGILTAFAEEI